MNCVLFYGISGSGKSTEARKCVENNKTVLGVRTHIERDEIRKMISPNFKNGGWKAGFPPHLEDAVTLEWYVKLDQANYYNEDVVISDTLCKISDRGRVKNLLDYFGYDIEWVRMETPLEECIGRDSVRGIWSVGEDVIRRQWSNLQKHKEHV
jgi:predicted kinase